MHITNGQDHYEILFMNMLRKDDREEHDGETHQLNAIGAEGKVLCLAVENWFANHTGCRKVIVITDRNVAKFQENELESLVLHMREIGIEVHSKILEPGEGTKSLGVAEDLWIEMAIKEFGRSDLMIAFGGGVIGDLTGFCASTYMRGIAYVQIPTTLLSQIDSSIGGKVAINLAQGKNLVGSFYNPDLVIMSSKLLKTLPNAVVSDGIGELMKYGYLGHSELMNTLKYFRNISGFNNAIDNDGVLFDEMIQLALRTKKIVVENDFKELGLRRYLNLGHTIGHAIEHGENFRISHGHCVANGCLWALRIAGQWDEYSYLKALMEAYEMPILTEIDLSKIMVYLRRDKKSEQNGVHFILPNPLTGLMVNWEDKNPKDERIQILEQYEKKRNLSDETLLLIIQNSARIQWISFEALEMKMNELVEG